MAYITAARIEGFGLRDRIAAVLKDLAERRERYNVYRTTVRELSSLSNRELADLGMHYSQIKRIAYDAAYGAK
ncbi:MAG: DUF1127 domain-containing protein [Rhodobacteraceae bacterium]|nr:DUF1127 domain-containing protein [Paracoccaceae bacterium]